MYLRKLSKRRTFESYLFHLVSVPSLKMGGGTHFWLVWSVPSKAKKSVPSNGINRVEPISATFKKFKKIQMFTNMILFSQKILVFYMQEV